MNYQAMGYFSANHSAVCPPSPQTTEFRQTTVLTTAVVDPSQSNCLCRSPLLSPSPNKEGVKSL